MAGLSRAYKTKKEEDKMNRSTQTAVRTFEGFAAGVREKLQERYSGCEVRTVNADKNNGLRLTGVAIMPEDRNVAPTIYLDGFYEKYLDGCPMDSIISEIASLYERQIPDVDIAIPDVASFEAVKNLICCRLINRERNRGRLVGMPHRAFLDLAVTYYIPTTVRVPFDGKIAVTGALMDRWGVDEDTLYGYALSNTRRLFPTELMPMEEILKGIGLEMPEDMAQIPVPMYILRCGENGGAAAMLFEPLLGEFADRYGDFYIFPSSISEVILLAPGNACVDQDYIRGMVREVNRECIAPDEVLSDNAYLYHADTGTIEILG